jgi:hypothetical protein
MMTCAAWCRWCRLVPLGAAGAAGAASSEQAAHISVMKQQAKLKSMRLTVFDHMKISKDAVSSTSINV